MSISQNYPAISPSLSLDFAAVQQLDPRITFTRASTATFYGTQTAKAEENLFTFSQEFDNAVWQKTATTVTANSVAAPDGSTTAETATETTATSAHTILTPIAAVASTYFFSVFLKKGVGATAPDWMQLYTGGTSASYANFNLSTGATGNSTMTTATISSVGNGWYRCTVSFTPAAGTLILALAFTNNTDTTTRSLSYAGQTTSDVFVWGAQVEQRSAVTAYTATTTQPITNYIPVLQTAASGVARFEHNPITFESLGLEIEEQRTNLALRSEEFDNASIWPTSNASVTANTAVAPDGTLTADRLIPNTTIGGHFVTQGLTVTAAVHTFSVYLKAAGYNWAVVYLTGPNVGTFFNLSNGTIGSSFVGAPTSSSITHVGNGWYRCSITATLTTSSGLRVYSTNVDGNAAVAGDNFSGLFFWGAQLEAGAFPTSYIQTVASQVTRAADSASMTGTNFSSWYNQAEGTIYADWGPCRGPASTSIGSGVVTLTSTVGVNDIAIDAFSGTTRGFITTNSANQGILSDTGVNGFNGAKASLAYRTNDFALSANGRTALTDTSAIMPTVNQMLIGVYASNPGILNGTIKKLAYYPLRVTNAQLQALTS